MGLIKMPGQSQDAYSKDSILLCHHAEGNGLSSEFLIFVKIVSEDH